MSSRQITYSIISFEEVKETVSKMFSSSTVEKWDLTPSDIARLANSNGIKFQWSEIDWWNAFEYGNREIDTEAFIGLLFPRSISDNEEIIIVTDECFSDKLAYQVKYKDLNRFCKTVYPNIYQMDFLQPHDFIFLIPQNRLLILLHHEGRFAQYKS